MYTYFNESRRNEERSKQGQINNKAKQHSTSKAVTYMYVSIRNIVFDQGL